MARTSAAVKNRYNEKTYDFFRMTFPKGEKEIAQAAAAAEGKSLAEYIRDAIDEHEQAKAERRK